MLHLSSRPVALVLALGFPRHRPWAIRVYSTNEGPWVAGLVFFSVYLITGIPPSGTGSDFVFLACWALTIAVGDAVIRRSPSALHGVPA